MHEARPPVRPSKVRAAIAFVVFVALFSLGVVAFAATRPGQDTRAALAFALVVVLSVHGALVALAVLGPRRMRYVVGHGALEVETLFGRQRWHLAGAAARTYQPGRLWRVGGTAMPGYFTGRYREAGRTTRVYATDIASPMVLVESPAARVLVSPGDRDAFLRALRAEGARVDLAT